MFDYNGLKSNWSFELRTPEKQFKTKIVQMKIVPEFFDNKSNKCSVIAIIVVSFLYSINLKVLKLIYWKNNV